MATQPASISQHSNRHSAEAACEHYQGVVHHESWCITRSEVVLYAYEAALDADKLTEGDQLILHALGVSWTNNCACKSTEHKPQQKGNVSRSDDTTLNRCPIDLNNLAVVATHR